MKYIKFLAVLLDEHLGGKYHIAELSKKLAKTCGFYFKVRYLLPTTTLITLYNALLISFLQYGIVAWAQTFDSYIEPLFKLQKRAVRAISQPPFLAYSLPIFKDLTLLRIVDIFKLRLLSFVYQSANMIVPGACRSRGCGGCHIPYFLQKPSVILCLVGNFVPCR